MWPFRFQKALTTRLTAGEACAIARDALPAPDRDMGRMAIVQREGGRLIWHVRNTAFGSGALVTVDDANGFVISVGRWGTR